MREPISRLRYNKALHFPRITKITNLKRALSMGKKMGRNIMAGTHSRAVLVEGMYIFTLLGFLFFFNIEKKGYCWNGR